MFDRVLGFFSEWFEKRKTRKIIKVAQKSNPAPKTWRMWEYDRWGYKIAFRSIDNKRMIFHIVGWLPERPKNGDWLIYQVEKGRYAKGIIFNIEYESNPPDMFFADVRPVEEIKM